MILKRANIRNRFRLVLVTTKLSVVTVAPRAGAWIETFILGVRFALMAVAPRAGAWIETSPAAGSRS